MARHGGEGILYLGITISGKVVLDRPGPDLWRGGTAASESLTYLAASGAPRGGGWGWGAAPSPSTPTSPTSRSWRAPGAANIYIYGEYIQGGFFNCTPPNLSKSQAK